MNIRPFIIIILFMVQTQVYGQSEFAPIGAKWYYEVSTWSSIGDESLLILESKKDTFLLDHSCKKITQTLYHALITPSIIVFDTISLVPIYVYQEDYRIYLIDDDLQSSSLLYDFNPELGDIWEINTLETQPYISCETNNSQNLLIVDSTNQISVDGILLNQIFTSFPDDNNSSYDILPIIERIGSVISLLPICPYFSGPEIYRLRCYEDNNIFYKNPLSQNIECNYHPEQYMLSTEIVENQQHIEITFINTEIVFNQDVNIVNIYTINGQKIYQNKETISSLNLSQFPKEMLIVQAINHTHNNEKSPITKSTIFLNF